MAESMTVQTLSYVADAFKFVAVPFAVMEILGPDQRKAIEQAVITRTKSTWWLAFYLSLPTFIGLHILVFCAQHLVLLFFVALFVYFVVQLIVMAGGKIEAAVAAGFLWVLRVGSSCSARSLLGSCLVHGSQPCSTP
jgi:uncharacterized protein (DUF697 family)